MGSPQQFQAEDPSEDRIQRRLGISPILEQLPGGQEKDTRGPRSLASTALTTGAGVISPLMSAAQLRPDGRLHRDAVQPPPPAPRWCPLGDTWASGFKKKAGHAVPSPWLHVHWQPEDFTAHVSEAEQASVLARCEGGPAGLTQPV
ncbi:unnamed protein product [Rangifer tarandus platyrhynchus]|uniref:Uncharacterized protein n=1 Tax=Rangifer tarandus platyrhynchus TaxID=3082113 RepID=A0AC59ZSL4_RANTA